MSVIREMTQDDVARVLEIEQSLNKHAWSRGILQDCLKVGYACYVLESSQAFIIGFAIQSYGIDEAHLLNIGVDSNFHRKGLGQKLLDHVIAVAKAKALTTMYLEVRKSNSIARKLYLKNGFIQVGIRKDYYPVVGGREDATIFKKTLL